MNKNGRSRSSRDGIPDSPLCTSTINDVINATMLF